MRFSLPRIRFIFVSIIQLLIAQSNFQIISVINMAFLVLGVIEAYKMLQKGYVYISALFFFHLLMTFFVGWVLLNYEQVTPEPIFNFSVFTQENLQIAFTSLMMGVLTIYIAFNQVCRNVTDATIFDKINKILMGHIASDVIQLFFITSLFSSFVIGSFFVFTNTTVLDIPYPYQAASQWMPFYCYKIPIVMASFAQLMAYYQKINLRTGSKQWLNVARLNFITMAIFYLLYAGSRGFITFICAFFSVLEFYIWKLKYNKIHWAFFFMIFAFWCYLCWPFMRVALARAPLDKVFIASFSLAFNMSDTISNKSEILLSNISMLSMSLFHFLYTIQLIKGGISLDGSTFYNLIPQSIPSFIYDFFGGVRPMNDNYRLEDQYSHGGGFFTFANAYWNGGELVAVVFLLILTLFFVWFDRRLFHHKTSNVYRFFYIIYFPVMLVQLGYGIQGLARVLEILSILILFDNYRAKHSFLKIKPDMPFQSSRRI